MVEAVLKPSNNIARLETCSTRVAQQLSALAEVIDPPVRLTIFPAPVESRYCPRNAIQVSPSGRPEVIVLNAWNAAQLVSSKVSPAIAAIVPVINVTGADALNQMRADIDVPPGAVGLQDALAILDPAIKRLRALPSSLFNCDEPQLLLLARLFVRDRGLIPRREAGRRETFVYPDESAIASVAEHAGNLVELGLLRREFHDTLLTCSSCGSGRLSARERCQACGSTHLIEESIIRHLRCSYQATEHEFRRKNALVCPKCRSALEYFSVDYDRPGMVSVCHRCGRSSGQTSVGFLCLDCEVDTDAPSVASGIIYRYYLTGAGIHAVRGGSLVSPRAPATAAPMQRVRSFVADQIAARQSFSILAIEFELPEQHSRTRAQLQTYSLFAALLRETFTPETQIIEYIPYFLVLLARDSKADVEDALPEIKRNLERHLARAPPIHYRVFGPEKRPLR